MATHSTRSRQRALVVGAGMAGLLTARILADHYDTVTLIEQDLLPDTPHNRRGVPQSAHLHGLLIGGRRTMEALLPGFTDQLLTQGAPTFDFGTQFALLTPYGWAARSPSTLTGISASRPLIEWTVRQLVLTVPNITLHQGMRVTGLTGDAAWVTGVRLQHGPAARSEEILRADLVVDGGGRGSSGAHWPTVLGCPPVPATIIDSRVGYASRTYRIPTGYPTDWRACYVQTGPQRRRGAALLPIEDGRWIVTLIGIGPERPSGRDDDFLPYARSLATPLIADALTTATPLSGVTSGRSTSSRRRIPPTNTPWPGNYLLTGDSLCCFNPIYAQGMTAAATQAALLEDCLHHRPVTPGFARHYHHRAASRTQALWDMAALTDLQHPETRGPDPTRTQRLLARYLARLQQASTQDPAVQHAFLHVFNLLRPPATLLSPRTATRVLLPAHRPPDQASCTAHRTGLPPGKTP
ncbi:FAD-dependent oxidoreductase [Streptomyces syringium]|uniref:FAD-dependent oxidoreductase n=1 Tax=Streptomyces syringium TaxID=76729 RepID=UPI0034520C65